MVYWWYINGWFIVKEWYSNSGSQFNGCSGNYINSGYFGWLLTDDTWMVYFHGKWMIRGAPKNESNYFWLSYLINGIVMVD
jgi:hypothetical protein